MLAKRNIVVEGPSDAIYIEHVLESLGRRDVRVIVAGGAAGALAWLRRAEPEADLLGWVRLVVLWDSDQAFRDLRKQLANYTRNEDYFVVEVKGRRDCAIETLIPPVILEEAAEVLAEEAGGASVDILAAGREEGSVTVGERFKIPLARILTRDWSIDRQPQVWAGVLDLTKGMLNVLK